MRKSIRLGLDSLSPVDFCAESYRLQNSFKERRMTETPPG